MPFPYLDKSHVTVKVDGVTLSPGTYTWPTDGTIKITAGNPPAGAVVERRRKTPTDPITTFATGNLDVSDLNVASLQPLYLAQEAGDDATDMVVRGWVTDNLGDAGTIQKGTLGQLAYFDADGNIKAGEVPEIFDLNFASVEQGVKADGALQRAGSETKSGNLRLTDGLLKVFKNLQTIPTSEDAAGMVVSFNRSNGDGETNIRNMFVNAFGASKAYVFSQIVTAGTAEVDLLTLYRNGQVKSGGAGWLEPLAGQTESIAGLAVLSKAGLGMPILGAVRTSDLTAPAYMAGQGLFGFGYNNRARGGSFLTTFLAWGGYFEARRDPGSGRAHGIEIGTVNLDNGTDPLVVPNPFSYAQDNQISSIWNSAGRPDVGNGQRDIEVGAGFIQNGPVGKQVSYSVGILWGENSVREVSGIAPVMRMPTRYQLEWYTTNGSGVGSLKSYLRSEQTNAATVIGTVYRDTALDFEFSGAAKVRMTTNSLRALDTNAGFDASSTYFGSNTPTQQWQFQTGSGALFVNRNTNTTPSPTWTNLGQFNGTTGAYTNVSDETVKVDFKPFGRDVMATVRGLADAVCAYRMAHDQEREWFGYRAQRVLTVLPEAITKSGELLMLEDRPIMAALTLAVDQLNTRLEAVELAA